MSTDQRTTQWPTKAILIQLHVPGALFPQFFWCFCELKHIFVQNNVLRAGHNIHIKIYSLHSLPEIMPWISNYIHNLQLDVINYPCHLTHWGWVTHICIVKLTIIGSDNGLSPGWHHAIIWTIAEILLIGPLGTNFSEILIGIQTFSFKKMHFKMSSAKWRPFVSASLWHGWVITHWFV